MILHELIKNHDLRLERGDGSTTVCDLTDDSRSVRSGAAFIARRGSSANGRDFIRQAIQQGAVAVITDCPLSICDLAQEPNGRSVAWVWGRCVDADMVGQVAEHFFGDPSGKLKLIGVTGTNGKTTTAFLIQHLLEHAGCRCGMIGTVYVDNGAQRTTAPLTTPGAIAMSKHLAAMVANGCQAAVTEVSSHGLDQGRTAALAFDAAVFTNLSGDHLDYHGTMANYAAAKAKLFNQLPSRGWAVVNADDPYGQRMVEDCAAPAIWCHMLSNASRVPSDASHRWGRVLSLAIDHSRGRFEGPWGIIDARIPLVGRHNVANMLQAMTVADKLLDLGSCLKGAIESCPSVPGRLEQVRRSDRDAQGPVVLVDYAHTHDALENVLRAVRAVTVGRVCVVFGCGGDRDRNKRPKMAAVACRLADTVVVTTDNPRTEDPLQIIDQVLAGVPRNILGRVTVEADRSKAIATAIRRAERADTVVLAGKGHEDYQIVGGQKRGFDDRQHARAALGRWVEHADV